MEYWKNLPAGTTPSEAFLKFIHEAEKRSIVRTMIQNLKRWKARIISTAKDERQWFCRISRLPVIRPSASIHEGRKDWYHSLAKQLLVSYMGYLQQKLGHLPYYDELTASWHDNLYSPASELYIARDIKKSFPIFYMGWMKSR